MGSDGPIPEPEAIPLREWVSAPTIPPGFEFTVVPPSSQDVRDRAALLYAQDALFHARVTLSERIVRDGMGRDQALNTRERQLLREACMVAMLVAQLPSQEYSGG